MTKMTVLLFVQQGRDQGDRGKSEVTDFKLQEAGCSAACSDDSGGEDSGGTSAVLSWWL
jgi:hypothetical protein